MTSGASIRPGHLVFALIRSDLHWISAPTRRVIQLLAISAPREMSAQQLARWSGLGNRHQLARALARDGLPSLAQLRSWIRLVGWVLAWESDHTSLYRLAITQDFNPAVCYRMIKRLTGSRWGDVRSRGVAWVLLQLRDRCVIRTTGVRSVTLSRRPHGGG